MYPHQAERLTEALDAASARALVATSAPNVQYVTGFSSPAPAFTAAGRLAVFTRHGTALVLPANEVPGAIDAGADADVLVCHGRLVGPPGDVRSGARRVEEVVRAAAPSWAEALAQALARLGVVDGPVGLDESGVTAESWRLVAERLASVKLVNGSEFLARARRVKSPYELERCAHALRIAEESLDAVIQMLERGTTEREAASLCAAEFVRRGAAPLWVQVLMGDRTWMPVAWPTEQALRQGALVRLDVGCAHRGYCASVARTAVLGEPPARVWDLYRGLHHSVESATAVITDGAAAERVVSAALRSARAEALPADRWAEVGHGIGLEAREHPELAAGHGTVLEAGEVLCVDLPYCEIGFLGLAIRNTVLVTTAGARVLNQSRHDLVVLD